MQLSTSEKSKSFSLIIPFFNRVSMFPRLASSIHSQITSDWEVIVCDDASTENVDIVKALCSNHRFRYHRLSNNRGPAGARNEGARIAQGHYLVFIDSDDYILPDFVMSYEFELMSTYSKLGWCGIKLSLSKANNKHNTDVWLKDKERLDLDIIMKGIYAGTNCGFYCSADFFKQIGGFDETLRHAEDTDFLIRAAYCSPSIKVINSYLVAVDKQANGRVTLDFNEKSKAYEKIIFKNSHYLKTHPLIDVKFKYKLAWAYLHSSEKHKAIFLFRDILKIRFHCGAFFLLISTSILGVPTTCKIHFLVSDLQKYCCKLFNRAFFKLGEYLKLKTY